MKKQFLMLCALSAMLLPPAHAAVNGWYSLSATWDAGQFIGQFYYDSNTAGKVTEINGNVTHTGRNFAVASVLFATDPDQTFVHNSNPLEAVGYDAGFYLNVLDQGTTLTLDLSKDSGLYDWAYDYAYYPALNQSALAAWSIQAQPVPEPVSAAMLALGLGLLAGIARRKQ